jgi:hypothetical protein
MPHRLQRHTVHRQSGQNRPSTTAPATKSLLRPSFGRRPGQSARLPPNQPHHQIPIVVDHQPGGPRVPSRGTFGRRPSERARLAVTGQYPKPYTEPVVTKPAP